MGKLVWKPGTMLYPLPAVMVSCGDFSLYQQGVEPAHPPLSPINIITIAWTGIINTNPPMTYISVRPSRHSYDIIRKEGTYVINLTTESLTKQTDLCGVKSGRDTDKFSLTGLTPVQSQTVTAPSILESPVNLECKVFEIKELGSHHMFLAEITSVSADDKYLDATGKFHFEQARPICYSHGNYYGLGKNTGSFGYSVKKHKKRNKRTP